MGASTIARGVEPDDPLEPRRRYATKAATAAKMLRHTVDASRKASQPRCAPTNNRPEVANSAAAAATAPAAAVGADLPPKHAFPAHGHLAACAETARRPTDASAQLVGATEAPTQGVAACAPTRGRLPGLRSLNGISRPGQATGHAPVPLLLAPVRGVLDVYSGTGAAPAIRATFAPALTSARPVLEATARRGSPPAIGPAAFLQTATRPAVALLPPDLTKRRQLQADAHGAGATAGGGGKVIGGSGAACGNGTAALWSGPEAPRAAASADSGGSGADVAKCPRVHIPGRRCSWVRGGGLQPDTARGVSGGWSDDPDSSEGDDDMEEASSYSSCQSCSHDSTGWSYDSAMEEDDEDHNQAEAASDDCMGHGTSGAKQIRAAAATVDGRGGPHSAKSGLTAPAASTGKADVGSDAAATLARADGGGVYGGGRAYRDGNAVMRRAVGLRTKASFFRDSPPWPLVPRPGRPGVLRFSERAARWLWPTLVQAAQEEAQLVNLFVEVPKVPGTTRVRALLKQYDRTGMMLKIVDEWPEKEVVTPDSLLQISPLPDGGAGALVQLANQGVWSYYYVRGGKRCRPMTKSRPVAGVEEKEREKDKASGSDVESTGVLQLRLGANLFANRSFDVSIRAAERLFGHLLVKPVAEEAQPCTGASAGGEASGGEEGGCPDAGAATAGGGHYAGTVEPSAKPKKQQLRIDSLFITVFPEAWPDTRFQIEFRYRFPRMIGMTSNGRHAYATLASDLVMPMILYGAQPGDMFELWRNPEGAPDEFVCRVVREDGTDSLRKREPGALGNSTALLFIKPKKRLRTAAAAAAEAAVAAVAAAAGARARAGGERAIGIVS